MALNMSNMTYLILIRVLHIKFFANWSIIVSYNGMLKTSLIALVTGLITIVPVSPSFAGSGTDGVIEVSWKDWKKNKAKNSARQKITFKHNPAFSWEGYGYLSVDAYLYNGDDEEISMTMGSFSPGNLKTTSFFQFCNNPGPKPYYEEIKWQTGFNLNPFGSKSGQFEVPSKFKK